MENRGNRGRLSCGFAPLRRNPALPGNNWLCQAFAGRANYLVTV
jgi:hypothetical protein